MPAPFWYLNDFEFSVCLSNENWSLLKVLSRNFWCLSWAYFYSCSFWLSLRSKCYFDGDSKLVFALTLFKKNRRSLKSLMIVKLVNYCLIFVSSDSRLAICNFKVLRCCSDITFWTLVSPVKSKPAVTESLTNVWKKAKTIAIIASELSKAIWSSYCFASNVDTLCWSFAIIFLWFIMDLFLLARVPASWFSATLICSLGLFSTEWA